MAQLDENKLHQFVGKMLGDLGGAFSVPTVRIGLRLGLFNALHEDGPATADKLAKRIRVGFSVDCRRWNPLDSAPAALAGGRAPLRWLRLLAGCRGRGQHPAQCSVALIRSRDFLLSRRRAFSRDA